VSETPDEAVLVEPDEAVDEDVDLGEDEPVDAEGVPETSIEEATAGYDAELDDPDDDNVGANPDDDRRLGGDE
jgi:hypothetical protein